MIVFTGRGNWKIKSTTNGKHSFLFFSCLFTHTVTIVICHPLPNQTNLAKCGFRLDISFLCKYSQPAPKVVHLFCDDEENEFRKSLLISLKH